jgi:perosamine synthetase
MSDKFRLITDKIRELFHEPQEFIPLHAPVFGGNEKRYLEECIDSTFVSSVGKFVDQFEHDIAAYTGAKQAIACVNGTNALHLALQLVGVEAGDEVITQSLTFIATCNAISYCGAKPVLLDVDKDTMGLSPASLKEWLNGNVELVNNLPVNKTTQKIIKACVPMHTFGHPVRIEEIVEICNEYNIEVVEDAAESLGSFYNNRHTGTFAKIGVISFNGNKVITTGGGGILLFNDLALASKAKHLTTQAKIPHAWEYVHDQIGYNYRMPNMNAALGVAQLENLEQFLRKKRQLANMYKEFFKEIDVDFVSEPHLAKSNYWLNTIVLTDKKERDAFLKFSNKNGVMTRPAWELMNRLVMFKDCQKGDLSNSEWLVNRIVNIPSSVIQ